MVGVRIRPAGLKMRRQHRSLDERLFVRFPALYRSFAAFWSRLPKRSRLRRLISFGSWPKQPRPRIEGTSMFC